LVTLNSDPSFPSIGLEVTAMGWGDTSYGGNASDVLLNVDLNIISDEQCALTEAIDSSGTSHNYQDEVTDWENALCALGVDGKDTCQGDSGGPLVVRGDNGWADIQVGVVSWGIECGIVGVPGIYSQVSTAYSWIQEEVCKGSVYASEAGFDCSSVAVASNVFVKSPTYAPTHVASSSNPDTSIPSYSSFLFCLSLEECYAEYAMHVHNPIKNYTSFQVGSYPRYGCFTDFENIYWGEGGTLEQMSTEFLDVVFARVNCNPNY